MPTIVVFSHLRWNFVYQRPQHLLSRLAKHFQVMVIEEPMQAEAGRGNYMTMFSPEANLRVYQPHTTVAAPGFHDDQLSALQALIAELPIGADPIVWFYTPMALPLMNQLHPSLVVFDCMDELSAFKNPPKQLLQRETALIKVADLVFTGGPSLYEAKRTRHPRAYCFPSSVDANHFRQALNREDSHPLQAEIPHPRLGFYGVIDERFDTQMTADIADAHPDWQIVLVGPVVKIDPADLPRRPNIHYMGQQDYKDLPKFLAGWDVCLMPFAMNESTKFISPTKVLEYMAAELPIVSTPVNDVVKPYSGIVAIAHDAQEFVRACEDALALSPEARARNIVQMREVVARTSWEETARQMRDLINTTQPGLSRTTALEAGAAAVAPDSAFGAPLGAPQNINPLRSAQAAQRVKCAIIGGGPTGLSAAYHLGEDTLLLEKNDSVGGWCRSIEDKGFTFDYAGHIMFSNDPYVLQLYKTLLGDNVHWQNREAWIYSKETYTRYPFQGSLYGLPAPVIKECILGAIAARHGAADSQAANDQCDIGKGVEDCCADGAVDLPTGPTVKADKPANFEQFIYKVWGAGIAKHFAIPYNKKIWTVPLSEMETSWLGGRVPLPDLGEIIEGALSPSTPPMGPNARFGYPLKGGFQALVDGFVPHIKGRIELNAEAVMVSPQEHLIALADGRRFQYDQLVSTMPLPELIKLIGDFAPDEVKRAAKGLQHISIRNVNLGIGRADITDKHWIYYPEDSIFHRIFVQGNASPNCNAPGGFALTAEISYSPYKPLPFEGEQLIQRVFDDLVKVGLLRADDRIVTANEADMPYAYVVYDHARADNMTVLKAWLAQYDIVLAGRYSEWEYYNSDHAFLAGKKAAEKVMSNMRTLKQSMKAE
jgi:UDP-galactopyranose mutase